MKGKVIWLGVIIISVLLVGCESQRNYVNVHNVWYDDQIEMWNLEYDYRYEEERTTEEESTEITEKFIEFQYISSNSETWESLGRVEFNNNNNQFNFELNANSGDYDFRGLIVDEYGEVLLKGQRNTLWLESPKVMVNGVWFDWENAMWQLDLGYNYNTKLNVDKFVEIKFKAINQDKWRTLGKVNYGEYQHNFDLNIESGEYLFKANVVDNHGNMLLESEFDNSMWLDSPRVLNWAQINQNWDNQADLSFEINGYFKYLEKILVYKTLDGGLTWEEAESYSLSEMKNQGNDTLNHFMNIKLSYFEAQQGGVAYKLEAYDSNDTSLDEYVLYEIFVEHKELSDQNEPSEVYWVNAYYDIYANSVDINWHAYGNRDELLLEYSNDSGETWNELKRLDILRSNYRYMPNEGEYLYRLSILNKDGEVTATKSTDQTTYVRNGAVIGNFDVWYEDWAKKISINWQIEQQEVSKLELYYTLDKGETWEIIGEYGPIKTMMILNDLDEGLYQFKILAYDLNSELVDKLINNKVFEIKEYPTLHDFYAYGNNNGDVYLNWWNNGERMNDVNYLMIEKSTDGIAWTVVRDNIDKYSSNFYHLEEMPGVFKYRLSAVGNDGVIIESLESSEIYIYDQNEYLDLSISDILNHTLDEMYVITYGEVISIQDSYFIIQDEFGNSLEVYLDDATLGIDDTYVGSTLYVQGLVYREYISADTADYVYKMKAYNLDFVDNHINYEYLSINEILNGGFNEINVIVEGEIVSINDTSFIIQDADGNELYIYTTTIDLLDDDTLFVGNYVELKGVIIEYLDDNTNIYTYKIEGISVQTKN